MNSRAYVKLGIVSSTLTAAAISEAVGIQPDSEWASGDVKKVGTVQHENNGWVIESKLAPETELGDHVTSLLSRLHDVFGSIRSISDRADVTLACVVYSNYNPELFFDKDVIQIIALLNANLDVDVYAID